MANPLVQSRTMVENVVRWQKLCMDMKQEQPVNLELRSLES